MLSVARRFFTVATLRIIFSLIFYHQLPLIETLKFSRVYNFTLCYIITLCVFSAMSKKFVGVSRYVFSIPKKFVGIFTLQNGPAIIALIATFASIVMSSFLFYHQLPVLTTLKFSPLYNYMLTFIGSSFLLSGIGFGIIWIMSKNCSICRTLSLNVFRCNNSGRSSYCCYQCLADCLWDQRGEVRGNANVLRGAPACFDGCGSSLTFCRIQSYLPQSFVNQYEHALTESLFKLDKHYVSCSCETVYTRELTCNIFKCISCKRKTCLQCGGNLIKNQTHKCKQIAVPDSKSCPACGALLQKVLGCNAIACSQCGTRHNYHLLKEGTIFV